MAGDFKGIVPPIITPFTAQGDVNEAAYRGLLDYYIEAGVNGFWVCGAAGEGVLLSDDERARVAEVSAEHVKGRAKVIMHIGAPSLRSVVFLAKRSAQAGVDAIASVPPLLYRPDDESVVRYFSALAEACDLPIFVYNLPSMAPIEVMPPLMERLVTKVPHIAGVKHSAPSFFNIYAFVRMGLSVFTGSSGLLLPALTMGAVGCIGSPLNVAPRLHVDIYSAFRAGDVVRAQELQRKAAPINAFCFQYPHIALYKTVLSQRLGFDCGTPRPPLPRLTEAQAKEVLRRIDELGAE